MGISFPIGNISDPFLSHRTTCKKVGWLAKRSQNKCTELSCIFDYIKIYEKAATETEALNYSKMWGKCLIKTHILKYIFSFFVKGFKSKHTSNNPNTWQLISMFETHLLHSHLYTVLFAASNRFSNVNSGHGICIWTWTVRNLSHSFPSLPPWRMLSLFLPLRYL